MSEDWRHIRIVNKLYANLFALVSGSESDKKLKLDCEEVCKILLLKTVDLELQLVAYTLCAGEFHYE